MNAFKLVALALLGAPLLLSAQQSVAPARGDLAARSCEWRPRCSTPGVTLALQETKRVKSKGITVVLYDLLPAGFPRDKVFTLWQRSIGSAPRALYTGFTADSTGALVCVDSNTLAGSAPVNAQWCNGTPLRDVSPAAGGYALGEPFRVALVATDETVEAYAEAYPFPVESAAGSCHLAVELVSNDPTTVALLGEGFEPGETVQMAFRSGQEFISHSLQVPADGAFVEIVSPGVKGKRGGMATYSVEGSKCRLKLTHPWGNDLKPQ